MFQVSIPHRFLVGQELLFDNEEGFGCFNHVKFRCGHNLEPRLDLCHRTLVAGVMFHAQPKDDVGGGTLASSITSTTSVRHAHKCVDGGGVIPLCHCPICALWVRASGI